MEWIKKKIVKDHEELPWLEVLGSSGKPKLSWNLAPQLRKLKPTQLQKLMRIHFNEESEDIENTEEETTNPAHEPALTQYLHLKIYPEHPQTVPEPAGETAKPAMEPIAEPVIEPHLPEKSENIEITKQIETENLNYIVTPGLENS
ncbi:MAG: hypothetical protein ABUK01_08005, partial [Leptospirales bacterium]